MSYPLVEAQMILFIADILLITPFPRVYLYYLHTYLESKVNTPTS